MNRLPNQLALLGVALGALACRATATEPPAGPVATTDPERAITSFAPALTSRTGAGSVDGLHLADVETCGGCHTDVFAQQQSSAHATSSLNNPIYRFGIDRFREAVSPEASQMCGGCHDIALLVDGAMTAAIEPTDERAHAGVTCRVCHGVEAATIDGNGSYALSRAPLPLPDGGPASVDRHRAAAAPIDGEALCGSCHRSFLSKATGNAHFLAGMDDLSAWKGSAYNRAGVGRVDHPTGKRSCVDCHMPFEAAVDGDPAAGDVDGGAGVVRSHRFLGGHTWLASMQGDAAQLERQRRLLRGALTVDIAAARDHRGVWTRPADGAPIAPGERLTFDVVVRNTGVGHSFPAGVKDAVDSWLEVSVSDARGAPVAGSGDADGESAHRFRALVADRDGRPQRIRNTQDFHQVVIDHTVAARDARVIRYALELPPNFDAGRLPLRIDVALRHRSRNLALQAAVCDASRTPRGRAFDRERQARDKPALDPCAPQPITEIASASTWIGDGAAARLEGQTDRAPRWRRLYEHGLGLLAQLPEEADAARESLLIARDDAAATGDPIDEAQILAALGAVYAAAPCGPSAPAGWPTCQGRLDAGLEWLDAAEALVPGHPALARTRAILYDRAARWARAARWWQVAADAAPDNAGVRRQLAVALAAIGDHRGALAAADRGLELVPRDGDLLRVRALALEALSYPGPEVAEARATYRSHARAERPTALRARCAAIDADCAREIRAVHTHRLAPRDQ